MINNSVLVSGALQSDSGYIYMCLFFFIFFSHVKWMLMNLLTKQKQTYRLRKKLMVTEGERFGGGTNWSLGVIYIHYYI